MANDKPHALSRSSLALVACAAALGLSCTLASDFDPGEIDFEPDRPESSDPQMPDPYDGSEPLVLGMPLM